MIHYIICGYYGYGNAGDEALLISLLKMLPNNIHPMVLSGNPEETQKRYGVESYSRISLISKLNTLGKGDVFIWGGGSLMQDSTSIRSPLFYAGLMNYARWRGLTTIAWAQGIGPLNNPFTRWLAQHTFNQFDKVSVRDKNSAKLLENWQIPYKIAPDPVWLLNSQSIPNLEPVDSPKVAINLRSHSLLTPERLKVLIEALILFQTTTKATILLVPFQKEKDEAIAENIAKQLPLNNQIINLTNPQELKGLFSQVKMVIGMRLHSLIMGLAEKCCCFALSYDPKVSILMEELNLPGYNLDELPSDSKSIYNYWLEVFNQNKTLSSEKINSLKKDALIHQQLLKSDLAPTIKTTGKGRQEARGKSEKN